MAKTNPDTELSGESRAMIHRQCGHCGTPMRWDSDPEEQCWKCFGRKHKGLSGPHREFDKGDKRVSVSGVFQ